MRTITMILTITTAGLAACEPTAPRDASKSTRPAPEEAVARAERPAVTESALTLACDPNDYQCVGPDLLEYCTSSGYAQESCTSICRAAGMVASDGCGYDASYDGDACFCAPVVSSYAPSCEPGWSCAGDSLEYCEDGAVDSWSCDSVCRDAGYDYALACDYDDYGDAACYCDDAYTPTCGADEEMCDDGSCVPASYVCDGYVDCSEAEDEAGCATECTPGEVLCSGDFTLDVCNDYGYWDAWNCDAVCQDAGYFAATRCGYDGYSAGDSCFCE